MIAIEMAFPAGRYHATPWGHHVNEGAVEWPPSPWRLVRSLVAASYKLVPVASPDAVRGALTPLLELPEYVVPPVGEGHTRHYMPIKTTTTKIIDAFVAPGDGKLIAVWPNAAIDPGRLALLDGILSGLTYLGRSESWVEARRITAQPEHVNCRPCPPDDSNLWLMAIEDEERYRAWCEGFAAAQRDLPKKERRDVPLDWWQVAHQDTGRLRKEGWSRTPGMRRVPYRLTPAALTPRARTAARAEPRTIARFEIRSAVLPRLTDALAIGDRARIATMANSDGHPTFSGRVARGSDELRAGHQHAFFLPTDDDGDGKIDHLLIYAREGFDDDARRALESVRALWGHSGHKLFLTLTSLAATSATTDLGGLLRTADAQGRTAQLGTAHVWHSLTPFVPPRHTKHRGGKVIDGVEDQVRLLLAGQGFPEPVAVTMLPKDAAPARTDWYRFQLRRWKGGGAGAGNPGCGVAVTFAAPVTGPIAIGYGAHQGLGQLVAIE